MAGRIRPLGEFVVVLKRGRRWTGLVMAAVAVLASGCDVVRVVAVAFDDQLAQCDVPPTFDLTAGGTRPVGQESHLRVYLLRGLAGVFSLGFEQLAEEMRLAGLDANAFDGPTYPDLASGLIDEFAGESDPPGIVLIGHSYGADDAIRMSLLLRDAGIHVRLLYLLDATSPPLIPDNVDQVIHLYHLWLPGYLAPAVFSGNPVELEPDNTRTQLVNTVIDEATFGPAVSCLNHFNVDASNLIQQKILDDVLSLDEQVGRSP